MRDYQKAMLISAAVEAIIFSLLIFGVSVILPEWIGTREEPTPFSWPKIGGGIALAAVLWFGTMLVFYRPTTWQLPATERDWLDQQIGYLRLQPREKRQLGAGGQAYWAAQTTHSMAELWIRPAAQAGQLRIDGPRRLIRKLQKRYAKRSGDKA
jgi:hypothetical protein